MIRRAIDCGAEIPIKINPHFNEVDDESGAIVTATHATGVINRYSFVWDEGDPKPLCAFEILDTIKVEELAGTWLAGWQHETEGDLRIRSMALESGLRRSGFATVMDDGIGLAVREAKLDQPLLLTPEAPSRIRSWALLLGPWPAAERLLEPPFRASLKVFCSHGELLPSKRFLEAMENAKLGVAYPMAAYDLRAGLVVVTSRELVGLDTYVDTGVLRKIWRNEEADQAWAFRLSL